MPSRHDGQPDSRQPVCADASVADAAPADPGSGDPAARVRPAVDEARLRAQLDSVRWPSIAVISQTGSTNADLAQSAQRGAAVPGSVLVAGHQTEGRGRLNRTWVAPPWAAVATSVLLAPGHPPARWGWLPMIFGLSVATGIDHSAGLTARLKWPNDVLIDGAKVCGILGQMIWSGPSGGTTRPLSVMGFGLNTAMTLHELPVPTATSLAIAAGRAGLGVPDPTQVLAAILSDLGRRLSAWDDPDDPDGARQRLRDEYLAYSDTVGRDVRVELGPGSGDPPRGRAVDVDDDGRLVVRTAQGDQAFGAGDVVHLR